MILWLITLYIWIAVTHLNSKLLFWTRLLITVRSIGLHTQQNRASGSNCKQIFFLKKSFSVEMGWHKVTAVRTERARLGFLLCFGVFIRWVIDNCWRVAQLSCTHAGLNGTDPTWVCSTASPKTHRGGSDTLRHVFPEAMCLDICRAASDFPTSASGHHWNFPDRTLGASQEFKGSASAASCCFNLHRFVGSEINKNSLGG